MNPASKKLLTALLGLTTLLLLCACSIHEQKQEGGNKKVDIQVPFAQIHVGTDTDAKDTGLASYPGAKPKQDEDNDKHRANISIGGEDFGLRVVVASFTSDDSPEKVIDFYRKDLKRFGTVLECKKGITENKGNDEKELRCSDHGSEEPGKTGSCGRRSGKTTDRFGETQWSGGRVFAGLRSGEGKEGDALVPF